MTPSRILVSINSLTPPTNINDRTPATTANKITFNDISIHPFLFSCCKIILRSIKRTLIGRQSCVKVSHLVILVATRINIL